MELGRLWTLGAAAPVPSVIPFLFFIFIFFKILFLYLAERGSMSRAEE